MEYIYAITAIIVAVIIAASIYYRKPEHKTPEAIKAIEDAFWKWREGKDGAPVPVVVVQAPPVPSPPNPGVVYAPPNPYTPYAGMTPQQVYGHFPNGLPVWWNWNSAYASGVINPDANVQSPPAENMEPVATGTVIPWNEPGQGRYLHTAGQILNLTLTPPAGFSGTKEMSLTATSSPFPTQFSAGNMTVNGVLIATFGATGFAGGVRTPALVGGVTYPVVVALNQQGACDIMALG